MFSLPKNKFWESHIREMINYGPWKWYIPYSMNIINSAGPGMLESTLKKYDPDIGMIPEKFFPTRVFGSKVEKNNITSDAYAYHFSDLGWRPSGIIYQEAAMMICLIIGVIALAILILYLGRQFLVTSVN